MSAAAPRTVLSGDGVGHIDFAVTGLPPHAAAGGAGVRVPLQLVVVRDVVHYIGLVLGVNW